MFDNLTDRTVLFWSGGLDSTLLLMLMIEQGCRFSIVQFRDHWTVAQKQRVDKMIRDWDLQVYSYPFRHLNLVGKGRDVSVIFEYTVGQTGIPVARDAIEGSICVADLQPMASQVPLADWDLGVMGTRRDDSHPFLGTWSHMPDPWMGLPTITPLWDWSRGDVIKALQDRRIDTEISDEEDTGNISLCLNCLNGTGIVSCPKEGTIESIVWDREANLQTVRSYYGGL